MLRHCSGDGRKREREREAPRVSKSPKIAEHGGSSPEVSPAPDGRPKAIFILDVKKKWRILSSEENADILRRVSGEGDLTTKRRQNCLVLQPCSGKALEHEVGDTKDSEERQDYMLDPVDLEMQKKVDELPGIPLVPSNHNKEPGVIFVLEKASLVPAYVGRKYQILNPDEHAEFLRKKKLNPYDYRPDIIHEALVGVTKDNEMRYDLLCCEVRFGRSLGEAGDGGGSIGVYKQSQRLCMAGRVQAVYVHTDQGVLIKVEPNAQIPKTLGPFCAMMSELLQKFSIKANGRGGKLLRLVENPVSKHLPVSSHKIGLSVSSRRAVPLRDYVNTISNDVTLVFVVGAMAHGKIDSDYTDDFISVSNYPLSAGTCLAQICTAVERHWNIL
ncbi:hypothetical protein RJ640_006040 [Escallonia rubra]|uniref:Ribosomal RNA small subunit methyltransferase NEP1 n=1 Tax=Escallonia rubra TaxID=112253 RepID=A0AA88RNK7_9ASTE|nr:hypothetical protein RJ640_006040 [Escallonia rubra]